MIKTLYILLIGYFVLTMGTVHATPIATTRVFDQSITKEHVLCNTGRDRLEIFFTNDKSVDKDWDGDGFQDLWLKKKEPKVLSPDIDAVPVKAGEQKSPCGKWLASQVTKGVLAFPFLSSDRPFGWQVNLAFIDMKSGKVIELALKRGSLLDTDAPHPKPTIVAIPGGIRFLTWNARTDASGGEATIRNQKVPVHEDDLLYWSRIVLKNGIVTQNIDREATWATTQFKSYFADQSSFEKAFALNSKGTEFANRDTIMTATIHAPNEVHCIQPTSNRQINSAGPWYCDDRK